MDKERKCGICDALPVTYLVILLRLDTGEVEDSTQVGHGCATDVASTAGIIVRPKR